MIHYLPPRDEIISTEGMDVLPGLWESHAHLMLNGHSDYAYWDKAYAGKWGTEIMHIPKIINANLRY